MGNALVHMAIAIVFSLLVALPRRRLAQKERRRNRFAVALFVCLLLVTIPNVIRDSSAGIILLVLTVVAGVGSAILLAHSELKGEAAETDVRP
jgi:uncharacterized membrane protein